MNNQTIPATYGRQEDIRFVSGHGHYTADIVPENSLSAVFLRSSIAWHIRLDCTAARTAPGVVAVLTANEANADGVGQMIWTGSPVRDDGGSTPETPRPTISGSEIRHIGEPVAIIIAETKQQAADAAEFIDLDIERDIRLRSLP